jgi:hypothetical protein
VKRERPPLVYTAAERDAHLPQALRALGDALRAIGRAWYGDDRVPVVLPPPEAP